ncbi:MAG: hypothetical protein Q9165_008846 [Trypethelium subeluteriae]
MESTTVQANMRVQTQQLPLTQYDAERQNLIEKTWMECLRQISNGSPSVTISNEVFIRFGQDGLNAIASRYSYLAALSNASQPTTSDNAQACRNVRRAKNKIARPPNAFILYRQHHHPKVKASVPEMHNNDISKLLGNQWKAEAEAAREEWRAKAEKAKAEHSKAHPDYQYQPRKPSEKKKRWTKTKAAALAKAQTEHESAGITEGRYPPRDDPSTLAMEDFTTNGWATGAMPSFESFENDQNILPTIIPQFATTENGEEITHELLPGERNTFQQMIAKHNSPYLSANPGVAANEIPESDQLSITPAPSSNNVDADGINWDDLNNMLSEHEEMAKFHLNDKDMMSQLDQDLLRNFVTGQNYYSAEAERQAGLDEISTDDLPSKMMSEELADWSTSTLFPDFDLNT